MVEANITKHTFCDTKDAPMITVEALSWQPRSKISEGNRHLYIDSQQLLSLGLGFIVGQDEVQYRVSISKSCSLSKS